MKSLLKISYKLHVIQVTGTFVHIHFSVLKSEHISKKNLKPSTRTLAWQNVNGM